MDETPDSEEEKRLSKFKVSSLKNEKPRIAKKKNRIPKREGPIEKEEHSDPEIRCKEDSSEELEEEFTLLKCNVSSNGRQAGEDEKEKECAEPDREGTLPYVVPSSCSMDLIISATDTLNRNSEKKKVEKELKGKQRLSEEKKEEGKKGTKTKASLAESNFMSYARNRKRSTSSPVASNTQEEDQEQTKASTGKEQNQKGSTQNRSVSKEDNFTTLVAQKTVKQKARDHHHKEEEEKNEEDKQQQEVPWKTITRKDKDIKSIANSARRKAKRKICISESSEEEEEERVCIYFITSYSW